jgi:hypothetical protein
MNWWPNVSNRLRCYSKPSKSNEKSSYNAMTHVFYFFGNEQHLMERVLGVNRFKLNRWARLGYIPVYDAMEIKRSIPDYPKTLKQICPYVHPDDWPEYEYRYEYHLREKERTAEHQSEDEKRDEPIYMEGGGRRWQI